MTQFLKYFCSLILCFNCFKSFSQIKTSLKYSFTLNLKSFGAKGDGKTNDQDAFIKLTKAVNDRGGNCNVIIPKGKYIVGKQDAGKKDNFYFAYSDDLLSFKNCKNVAVYGNKAIIKYKDSLYFGSFDPSSKKAFESKEVVFSNYKYAGATGFAIKLENCNTITIEDLEFDGNNTKYKIGGRFGDVGIQMISDGINIANSKNIIIKGLNAHHFGRDGAMVINDKDKKATDADNILFTNCVFKYNGRQGLSIVGGIDVRLEYCELSYTGYGGTRSNPGAGIDIEEERGVLRNVRLKHCIIKNNWGPSFVADSGESEDVEVTDSEIIGINSWSVWVTKPNYTFKNCIIRGSVVHAYKGAKSDKEATKFYNCTFDDARINGKEVYGRYLVEMNGCMRLKFINCTFNANEKKAMWIDGTADWTIDEKPLVSDCVFNCNMKKIIDTDFIFLARGVAFKNNTYNFITGKVSIGKRYVQDYGLSDLGGNKTVIK
jgi:predicted 3-demethylubiquinone-9 3-methyltransferase (glyoxalase superfamily)